jgi:tRNA dimethylallyltransferase
VEVLELTGRRPSDQRGAWDRPGERYDLTAVGLTWARGELFDRAVERAARQIESGLVEEVRSVVAAGLSKTSRQALGIPEFLPVVEGSATVAEATDELVRNTKAFIRRQLSWFRSDARIEWVDASGTGWDGARGEIVERFVRGLS